MLVDSHCHLNLLDLSAEGGDLNHVIERAKQAGVEHILNVSINLADFPQVLSTAKAYPFVSASVGLHPNDQDEEVTVDDLIKHGQDQKVIAVGETGLDYFRSTGDVEWQRDRFRRHIQASIALKKPLIIHTRQANEDTLAIMQSEAASRVGGVMHCFTEDWNMAKQALDLGFYISFSGIVTFKNAEQIQETAKQVPLDRMLVETDAPYLAPLPHRGKPNEPGYVRHTAEFIAKMRDISLEELAAQTTQNFYHLFTGATKQHV
jgi:TatD DNase family protein